MDEAAAIDSLYGVRRMHKPQGSATRGKRTRRFAQGAMLRAEALGTQLYTCTDVDQEFQARQSALRFERPSLHHAHRHCDICDLARCTAESGDVCERRWVCCASVRYAALSGPGLVRPRRLVFAGCRGSVVAMVTFPYARSVQLHQGGVFLRFV